MFFFVSINYVFLCRGNFPLIKTVFTSKVTVGMMGAVLGLCWNLWYIIDVCFFYVKRSSCTVLRLCVQCCVCTHSILGWDLEKSPKQIQNSKTPSLITVLALHKNHWSNEITSLSTKGLWGWLKSFWILALSTSVQNTLLVRLVSTCFHVRPRTKIKVLIYLHSYFCLRSMA